MKKELALYKKNKVKSITCKEPLGVISIDAWQPGDIREEKLMFNTGGQLTDYYLMLDNEDELNHLGFNNKGQLIIYESIYTGENNVEDPYIAVKYYYNERGDLIRVSGVVQGDSTGMARITYNAGRMTVIEYFKEAGEPDGKMLFEYNGQGLCSGQYMLEHKNDTTKHYTYEYDNSGKIIHWKRFNYGELKEFESYKWNKKGYMIESISHLKPSGPNRKTYTYEKDTAVLITSYDNGTLIRSVRKRLTDELRYDLTEPIPFDDNPWKDAFEDIFPEDETEALIKLSDDLLVYGKDYFCSFFRIAAEASYMKNFTLKKNNQGLPLEISFFYTSDEHSQAIFTYEYY